MLYTITISAQAPFSVYKPVIVPQRSYPLPDLSIPDPMEDIIRHNKAVARSREIVSSDIITADGFNYISETYNQLKIKIIQRRNGQVEFHCLGIKKNGTWSICEKEIVSLEGMYKAATKESDKKMILELMEYGNYLLIVNPNSDVYIIE